MGHLMGTRHFLSGAPWVLNLVQLGVRTFFVISGYLISTLLFKDRERIARGMLTARQGFFRFYIRRVFRIFPAVAVLILVVAGLAAAGRVGLLRGDMLAAATFTTNFHHPRAWWLGHLWSLSVEEQFYLLWPAVVLLLSRSAALRAAAAALVIAPLTRVVVWYAIPAWRDYADESFPMVFDALATGCLLAGLGTALDQSDWYLRFLRSPAFVLVQASVVIAALLSSHPRYDLVLGEATQNVGIALIVDRTIRYPETTAGRFLNSRVMMFIGSLSYSLFLWQQLFLNRHSNAWSAAFPMNLLLAVGAAFASYLLIERPCLRFRARHFASPAIGPAPAAAAPAPDPRLIRSGAVEAPVGAPGPRPFGG
jgi:peptidoglycan/LPS O-acetylase OafA/YrhL